MKRAFRPGVGMDAVYVDERQVRSRAAFIGSTMNGPFKTGIVRGIGSRLFGPG